MTLAFLTAFFSSNVLFALMFMLALDWISGLTKAYLSQTICSREVGVSLEKAIKYIVVFTVLRTLSIVMTGFNFLEYVMMAGLLLKESLSVIENIKAIEIIRGTNNPITDKLIKILGMDLDKILSHIKIEQRDKKHD